VLACSGNGFSRASDRVLSLIFMWTFFHCHYQTQLSLVIILYFIRVG
jgi:hypothetical protein